jgi:hypothetical protein
MSTLVPQISLCPWSVPFLPALFSVALNNQRPKMFDENILMGEMAYNFLVCMAGPTSCQTSPGFLGRSSWPEDTYGATGPAPLASSSAGCTTLPQFPLSPTPSPTSTPEYRQASSEPSPTPEASCRQAVPVWNPIQKKWSCSGYMCNNVFRRKSDCIRHIDTAGKRSKCVACGQKLIARGDSWLRHSRTCKGGVGNLRFEDAFVEV